MKKLILLIALTLPLMGQAQPPEGQDWWACQSVEAGGLIWKNGQWESTGFKHDDRFILIGDTGNIVTVESVGKIFGTKVEDIACVVGLRRDKVSCISEYGETFIFSRETNQGATGHIYGAINAGNDRDTVTVQPFECAKG